MRQANARRRLVALDHLMYGRRRARFRPLWFVVGLAGGMATLFFLDSRRGAARRQVVLDQVVARTNEAVEIGGKKARSG